MLHVVDFHVHVKANRVLAAAFTSTNWFQKQAVHTILLSDHETRFINMSKHKHTHIHIIHRCLV